MESITRIDSEKGEQTAQACANAWYKQIFVRFLLRNSFSTGTPYISYRFPIRYLWRDPYKYGGVGNWHLREKFRVILGGTCDGVNKFTNSSPSKGFP